MLLLLLGAIVMIEQIIVEIATGKTRWLEVRKAAVNWQLVIVIMSTAADAVGNDFTNIDGRTDGTDGSRRLESSSASGVNVQIHAAGCIR